MVGNTAMPEETDCHILFGKAKVAKVNQGKDCMQLEEVLLPKLKNLNLRELLRFQFF